jgi:fatty acid-binding protein DegV
MGDEPLRAVVLHAACVERAEALAALLPEYLDVAEMQIEPLTPVIGAHVGNGTLGLCCCPMSICGLSDDSTGPF